MGAIYFLPISSISDSFFLQSVLGGVTYLLCILIYNKSVILWRSGFTFYSISLSCDSLDAGRYNVHGDTIDHINKRTFSVSVPFYPQNPPTSPHAYEGRSTAMLGAGSQFGMGNNELLGGFCHLPFIKQWKKGWEKALKLFKTPNSQIIFCCKKSINRCLLILKIISICKKPNLGKPILRVLL